MKSLTAKAVVKILKTHGFVLARKSGSHQIWKKYDFGAIVIVPMHGSKVLPIGTFLAIVKQSKLGRENFRQ